jgi:RNA-directed DNA polymerase
MGNTGGALKPESVSTKQERIAELARSNRQMAFTSLNGYLDIEWLRHAYEQTRKDGAVGVDGQTAQAYAVSLEANLANLLARLKSGRYRAPPVRRVYIPKAGSTTEKRPLGIPAFEDKVAQRAIVMLLEAIYEQDFRSCSFGFRRGRSAHQALQHLRNRIMDGGGRWVLDVDLRRYFDSIDHGKLRELLANRVVDGVIRRLIDKWLKAGVLEDGQLHRSSTGTPQGGVISPLLANVYLHYVLDEWFHQVVEPRMKGRCTLVRFCDDFVMVFEDFLDSQRVLRVLGKRMGRFGLTLHPDKTCLVDFRFKRPGGIRHRCAQATCFNFLGFTHVWGRSRRGKPVVYQRTAKDRYARTLKTLSRYCQHYRHRSLEEQHARLSRMLRGHYAYFGITGNGKRLRWLAHRAQHIWRKWLSRRTRNGQIDWLRFKHLLARYPLPVPRIVHQYAATSEAAM